MLSASSSVGRGVVCVEDCSGLSDFENFIRFSATLRGVEKMVTPFKYPSSVKDVDQHKFVKAFASFLKKSGKIKVPDWVDLVKTSRAKELAPYDEDWFYIRCAAIARHLYIRSPIGTSTVTKIFGTRKRNGATPSHFCRSSGNVARKALQALESVKLVEKVPDGVGRRLTSQGRRDLDRIASQMNKTKKVAA